MVPSLGLEYRMVNIDSKQAAAIKLVAAITDIVRDMGEQGCPSGPLYAALMQYGMSYDTYSRLMAALVKMGHFRLSNHVYYWPGREGVSNKPRTQI
jgi:hypothetical protein